MWSLGTKPKKPRHLLGLVASHSGDKGGISSGQSPGRRDDSIVITASAVAPTLPAVAPGLLGAGAGQSSGMQLSHLHSHGSGGPLGQAAGAPSGACSVPVGLPYQRIHLPPSAASTPAADLGSLDEGLARSAALSSARRGALCEGGLPDPDMCALGEDSGLPAPATATATATVTVVDEALSRGRWLLGLLIVQSTSSFVLDAYQELLRDHLVVTLFLTMLVGAGGNAGNQSAIKVIRGLATGAIRPSWPSARATLRDQAVVGLLLGAGLSAGGFVRVYATHGDAVNAAAISVSLFLIVMTSVVLGTGLPFALARAGVDPANAGTSIQVLMDILGVAITCVTCNFVLVQLAAGLGAGGALAH